MSIVSRANYARRVGRELLRGRDIRRQCLAKDSDPQYEEPRDAVNNRASEAERLLARDPAHVAEFTRGRHMAANIPDALSERMEHLVLTMDGRLERLSGIRKGLRRKRTRTGSRRGSGRPGPSGNAC
jgi:hypothetical protein